MIGVFFVIVMCLIAFQLHYAQVQQNSLFEYMKSLGKSMDLYNKLSKVNVDQMALMQGKLDEIRKRY